MLKECLENTSAHGIPHLVNGKDNTVAKCCWIVIIVGSFCVFGWHASTLIDKYYQFDTAVSINLEKFDFIVPDIFVCNNNPFSFYRTNLHLRDANPAYIEFLRNVSGIDVYYHKDYLMNRHYPGYSKRQLYELLSKRNYEDILIPNEEKFVYMENELIKQWYEIVPNSYHISCYKLREEHKHNVFFKNRINLPLFTDEHSLLAVNHSDPLVMKSHETLHAAITVYSNLLESSHTVYFTNPGEYPHLATTNVKIERGTRTEITLSMDYFERMATKNYFCRETPHSVTYQNSMNDTDFVTYQASLIDCAYNSLNEDLLKQCNCTYGLHPINEHFRTKKEPKFCWNFYAYIDKRICYEGYLITSGLYNKGCQNESLCIFPAYKVKTESYPLRNQFITNICNTISPYFYGSTIPDCKNKMKMKSSLDEKIIRQSFSQVTIHAPDYLSTLYKENFVYDVTDVISDIGGILGFYVGVSVVTFMEVFGFAARHLAGLFCRKEEEEEEEGEGDRNNETSIQLSEVELQNA